MPRRRRSLVVLLPVLALLALPGAAPARTKVEPGSTWISVELPSRGDWRIEIATAADGKSRSPVSISANDRAAQASLDYGVQGRWTKDGTIVAKFPGLGRVNLRFDQTEVTKQANHAEPGCAVGGQTLVRTGEFRGRIELDDRRGFGRLNLGEAPGKILDFPAETCPIRKERAPEHGGADVEEEQSVESAGGLSSSFHTGRKFDGGELGLDVETYPGGLFGQKSPRQFEFAATFEKTSHGLSTFATATAPLTTKGFDFSGESEATIAPPTPFSGSAAFKLESPTRASWTGDLSVAIPTLGEVQLTTPGTWATLCEGASCTETSPPGIKFTLLGSDQTSMGGISRALRRAQAAAPGGRSRG
ncbi:MAG TPA: hypothetical protein VGC32_16080 [Solirubrobacterales bacterium]